MNEDYKKGYEEGYYRALKELEKVVANRVRWHEETFGTGDND